jgi:F-type H+-transporting ATPase subunit a
MYGSIQVTFSLIEYFIWKIILFIKSVFLQQIGNIHVVMYFPFVCNIAFLILISNILGLVPYSFTLTSHIYFTATLSISLFIGLSIIGMLNSGIQFLNFFIPSGIDNKGLLYFLICIEVVSYFMRPLSLAIRLFANMLAGHTLLFILGGAVLTTEMYKIYFVIVLPVLAVIAIVVLEIAIAFIQTYVFTILMVLYLFDMYNLSH